MKTSSDVHSTSTHSNMFDGSLSPTVPEGNKHVVKCDPVSGFSLAQQAAGSGWCLDDTNEEVSAEFGTLREVYTRFTLRIRSVCCPMRLPARLYLVVVMCGAGQLGPRSRTRLWAEWSAPCVKVRPAGAQLFFLLFFLYVLI